MPRKPMKPRPLPAANRNQPRDTPPAAAPEAPPVVLPPIVLSPSSEAYWPALSAPTSEVPAVVVLPAETDHAATVAAQRAEDRAHMEREAEERRRREQNGAAAELLGSIATAHGNAARDTMLLLQGMEALALLADLDRHWLPPSMTFAEVEARKLYEGSTMDIWRHARRLLVASGRTPV